MKLRVSIIEDGGEFSGDFTLERIITCVRFCMGVPSDRLKPAGLLDSFRPMVDGRTNACGRLTNQRRRKGEATP